MIVPPTRASFPRFDVEIAVDAVGPSRYLINPDLIVAGIEIHHVFPGLITLDERVPSMFFRHVHRPGNVLDFLKQRVVEEKLRFVADDELG